MTIGLKEMQPPSGFPLEIGPLVMSNSDLSAAIDSAVVRIVRAAPDPEARSMLDEALGSLAQTGGEACGVGASPILRPNVMRQAQK